MASALTLLAAAPVKAAEAQAPVHAPAPSDPEQQDTLMRSATKSLIESFGELSRTAAKLSDTALKLMEAQEQMKAEKPGKHPVEKKTSPKNASEKNSDNSLKEIAAEITSISSELTGKTQPKVNDQQIIPADTTFIFEETVAVSEQPAPSEPEYDLDDIKGGQLMWVPDENIPMVRAILNGESLSVGEPKTKVDLNEMVYWRGDSIPMALPTKRLGRFDRKLYNWLIYPKGLWHFGLSANYGELSTDDSEFLSLIQDVDLKGKIYSIKPSVSYFIRNNVCVGMRLAFTKGDMSINSFKVDIDDDMSFNLHDIKYASDSYAAAVFIQQYFGLSRRGRFAVFNEAEVAVGTGNTHFIRPFDGNLRDTRTKTQSFNINYSPGVSIMVMKNAAFNVSFGVFGFHLKKEKQWENGEESGDRFTSGINFRFNIFNINFGVAIII